MLCRGGYLSLRGVFQGLTTTNCDTDERLIGRTQTCSRYNTSFKLTLPDPLSKGLGCVGDGFHPIYTQYITSEWRGSEHQNTYHVYDLESRWNGAIFISVEGCNTVSPGAVADILQGLYLCR